MIHRKPNSEHTLQWKKRFADSCFGYKDFSARLALPPEQLTSLQKIDEIFPIQLTRELLELAKAGKHERMLKQYLPDEQELTTEASFTHDPLDEADATFMPGVIKKYAHRLLLITTSICPVHCRYCFRKNYRYPKSHPGTHQFKEALAYIDTDDSLNEVILSGGDPLSLEDKLLDHLVKSISKTSHIKTLRLHTKYPSIIPERVTPSFLDIFTNTSLNIVFVFHINHPDEVSEGFFQASKKIREVGAHTLNQSVLLKGVNDDAMILADLSHKLFSAGVLPYYLHMLDHATGNRHFEIDQAKANKIITELKSILPGYLVPRLAREVPGQPNKIF